MERYIISYKVFFFKIFTPSVQKGPSSALKWWFTLGKISLISIGSTSGNIGHHISKKKNATFFLKSVPPVRYLFRNFLWFCFLSAPVICNPFLYRIIGKNSFLSGVFF